jgi:hypothetical protein
MNPKLTGNLLFNDPLLSKATVKAVSRPANPGDDIPDRAFLFSAKVSGPALQAPCARRLFPQD